jgi:simple sugar transport system permease protein
MTYDQLVRFVGLVMLALVPYILASQGTMLAGRTGVFNVAQEGIMLLGASAGFLAAYLMGNLVYGLIVAGLAGAFFSLVIAFFTTRLKMDQFVIGLAVFFLCLGLANLLYKVVVGVTLTPPIIPTFGSVAIPGLAAIPLIGPALFDQNVLVYFSVVVSVLLYVFLYRTPWGLELRSVGENPMAADSLGVNVAGYRYWTSAVGGALMGLAGAYLPMVYTGAYTQGIVHGRGWLAIALTFFGGWKPQYIFLGSLFFAGVDVLALQVQVGGFHIAHQALRTLPYLATMLVMVLASRGSGQPAFLGLNYDRESRTGT